MNDPLAMLMLQTVIKTLGANGGYGGINTCIKCKEAGMDKYVDANGLEASFCDVCPNNMQAVKWGG